MKLEINGNSRRSGRTSKILSNAINAAIHTNERVYCVLAFHNQVDYIKNLCKWLAPDGIPSNLHFITIQAPSFDCINRVVYGTPKKNVFLDHYAEDCLDDKDKSK